MNEYDLSRFREAQERDYPIALQEIRQGLKQSHWIWYIFPQLKGLGRSSMSDFYGLDGLGEAQAYLQDPVLSARLIEITTALLALPGDDPEAVLGDIDAHKVRSCMTLFHCADPSNELYPAVLEKYYRGRLDRKTMRLLGFEK